MERVMNDRAEALRAIDARIVERACVLVRCYRGLPRFRENAAFRLLAEVVDERERAITEALEALVREAAEDIARAERPAELAGAMPFGGKA